MNDDRLSDQKTYTLFRQGVYLHYRGQLYEATHLAHDANHEGRVVVHYIGLQLDGAHDGPRHAVRSWEDWNAYVHQDGSICETVEEGKCPDRQLVAPRFAYLGPVFHRAMTSIDPWTTSS